jgi:hypothetical protein
MLNAIETRTPPTIDYLSALPEEVGRVAAGIGAEVARIDNELSALDVSEGRAVSIPSRPDCA